MNKSYIDLLKEAKVDCTFNVNVVISRGYILMSKDLQESANFEDC